MKITKTQLITDENDVPIGINLDIEIGNGDALADLVCEEARYIYGD